MFKQYNDLVKKAHEAEKLVNKKYDDKKTQLSIKIRNKLQDEIQNINRKTLLKNYCPIQYTNEMTLLSEQFSNITKEYNNELFQIKNRLNRDLMNIMELPKSSSNYPTELYKIINHNDSFICKVYFTLVPLPEFDCKEGDPIRLEWVVYSLNKNTENITATTERTAQGWPGLKMPQFINNYQIIYPNNFCDFYQFGSNSLQQKWWMEWVSKNRPM